MTISLLIDDQQRLCDGQPIIALHEGQTLIVRLDGAALLVDEQRHILKAATVCEHLIYLTTAD